MKDDSLVFTLLGLNRAGGYLYKALFVLAIPALTFYTVFLPRMRFHDVEEQMFRAARHGDTAGVERSIAAGGNVNALAPIDRKTALFRAAVFGHADVVRLLLEKGADPAKRGSDDQTLLQVTRAARAATKEPAAAAALDRVLAVLRDAKVED